MGGSTRDTGLITPHSFRRRRDDYVEVMRSLKASVDTDIAEFLCHVPLLACCTASELLALAQVRSQRRGDDSLDVRSNPPAPTPFIAARDAAPREQRLGRRPPGRAA